jgi:hypothetical protein
MGATRGQAALRPHTPRPAAADTTIDEAVARVSPALRLLLGNRVELIAREAAPALAPERKLTVDELLASRIKPPLGIGPLYLENMERAIAEFAARGGHPQGGGRKFKEVPGRHCRTEVSQGSPPSELRPTWAPSRRGRYIVAPRALSLKQAGTLPGC